MRCRYNYRPLRFTSLFVQNHIITRAPEGQEDCLVLNVFTMEVPDPVKEEGDDEEEDEEAEGKEEGGHEGDDEKEDEPKRKATEEGRVKRNGKVIFRIFFGVSIGTLYYFYCARRSPVVNAPTSATRR